MPITADQMLLFTILTFTAIKREHQNVGINKNKFDPRLLLKKIVDIIIKINPVIDNIFRMKLLFILNLFFIIIYAHNAPNANSQNLDGNK